MICTTGHQVVSLHAEIPSDFTLVHAHEIIDRLETRLDRELGVMSVIHMDPVDSKDHQAHLLRSRVLKKLKSMDPEAGLHDFRILRGDDIPAVSFDAQFPFSYKECHTRRPCLITPLVKTVQVSGAD